MKKRKNAEISTIKMTLKSKEGKKTHGPVQVTHQVTHQVSTTCLPANQNISLFFFTHRFCNVSFLLQKLVIQVWGSYTYWEGSWKDPKVFKVTKMTTKNINEKLLPISSAALTGWISAIALSSVGSAGLSSLMTFIYFY